YSFSPATQTDRFFVYGTNGFTDNEFHSVDPFANSFQAGMGYLIRMPHQIQGANASAYASGNYNFSFEGVFTGVPNNGTVTVPLSNSSGRYTLVGNPYPSPINVHAF